MELYPGLRMIDAPFENGRQINLWLWSGQRRLLVDSGVAGVPTQTILPYLAGLGLTARDLALLVNLHAHADHVGGDAELVSAAGGALPIGAHVVDAPAVADHRVLATAVYGQRDEERIAGLVKRCGANVVVTERYQGGETIDLGGLRLEVIHAPGHTAGNISLYDPVRRALVHGESVMGPSQVGDQGLRSTPFGADPGAYRRTLQTLLGLEVELFLSSHRPPLDGAGGREAMRDSLASLEEYEAACRAALAQGARSVEELATAVAEQGHYQGGPRLQQQVGHTLQSWLREGIALGAPTEGYRLAR